MLALVGGSVAYLFYFNGQLVQLQLGSESSLRVPLAALLLATFAIGAGVVLVGGLVRAGATGIYRWRRRRNERHRSRLEGQAKEGRFRLWAGEHEPAIRQLSRVVEQRPDDLGAVLALSTGHAARGDLDSAHRLLESARAHHPRDPRLLARLAQLALRRSNSGAAVDYFREAVSLRPTSPRLLAGYSAALEADGNFKEAAAIAKRWAEVERDPSRRQEANERWLALRYRDCLPGGGAGTAGDLRAAIEPLRRLTADAPDYLPAQITLADALRAAGDLRGAERIYRTAAWRAPHGALLDRLAELHAELQRAGGAADRVLGVLKSACDGQTLPGPRLVYARRLITAGKLDAAEAILNELGEATDAVRCAPERDLVAGELALARGRDHQAALLLARAATGGHLPFAYACSRCGREEKTWLDRCRCGAYGSYEWIIA